MTFQAQQSDADMSSDSLTLPASAAADRRPKASNPVSLIPRDSITAELEDAIREDFIRNCYRQITSCVNRWEASGDEADWGEALWWAGEMADAIAARKGVA